jgi:ubiquinone/menaquinone biosynthesis C-methylase UbiE
MPTEASQPAPLPPQAVLAQMVLAGWSAKILTDVTSLDVADILKREGPCTAADLVQKHGVAAQPEALERSMRACAALNIFSEDSDGRFGPTPMSDALTLDSPVSVKKMVECFNSGSFWKVFSGFGDVLRTGKPQAKAQLGMEWWDYLNAHPKELELFGEAMKSNSTASMQGVLDTCDLSNSKKIVDVGGGFGHLAIALLKKYPHLQGTVLDVADLIPIAKQRMGATPRLEYVAGSMFESVPPADVYILKHIIHDWNDEQCIQILRNCHRSMESSGEGNGRLICVDSVLPPLGDTSGAPSKLTDIAMMAFLTGKERTKVQWEHLYNESGFRITAITTPGADNLGTSIIEGMKLE